MEGRGRFSERKQSRALRTRDRGRVRTARRRIDGAERVSVSVLSYVEVRLLMERGRLRISQGLGAWRRDLVAAGWANAQRHLMAGLAFICWAAEHAAGHLEERVFVGRRSWPTASRKVARGPGRTLRVGLDSG